MESFETLPLIPELRAVITSLGFKAPTPIQAKCFGPISEGKDLLGKSKTGSGKTLAYSLPLLNQINPNSLQTKKFPEVMALVLCPTRELSTQVTKEVRSLGKKHMGLRVLTLTGGNPTGPELASLEGGVHIVVGTPGRVLDHLERRSLDLRKLKVLILDEADRMLEMGFQDEMTAILNEVPEKHQTLLFSATYPKAIERLSNEYQKDAVHVSIEETNDTVSSSIEQSFVIAETQSKNLPLLASLSHFNPNSCIVFCNMKNTVKEVAGYLRQKGVSAQGLHGDLEQRERDQILARFRNRSLRVLVATDVAARGLDIPDMDLVINYDLPKAHEIYVHRIGRTGRAGKSGTAVTLILPREEPLIEKLSAAVKVTVVPLTLEPAPKDFNLDSTMDTLYISGGKKDKMRPGDILGALTGEAGGLEGTDIGKIEIFQYYSYVAVSKEIANLAVNRLSRGRIKGKTYRIGRVE